MLCFHHSHITVYWVTHSCSLRLVTLAPSEAALDLEPRPRDLLRICCDSAATRSGHAGTELQSCESRNNPSTTSWGAGVQRSPNNVDEMACVSEDGGVGISPNSKSLETNCCAGFPGPAYVSADSPHPQQLVHHRQQQKSWCLAPGSRRLNTRYFCLSPSVRLHSSMPTAETPRLRFRQVHQPSPSTPVPGSHLRYPQPPSPGRIAGLRRILEAWSVYQVLYSAVPYWYTEQAD